MTNAHPRLVVIVGPTSSGKTELAIQLAQKIDAEILSADSRQIYKELSIGTGKPTSEQLKQVPHHMISSISAHETMTADHFAKQATKHYKAILARKPYCLLVGGTGLWIQAFIDGMDPVPPADPAYRKHLKARIQREGQQQLYNELATIDPERAAGLFPGDSLRIIRALEIYKQTGQKASTLRSQPSPDALDARWIGLDWPRPELYKRGEEKVDQWIDEGWMDEVNQLKMSGLTTETPAMQAIGYAHFFKYLNNEQSYSKTVELIKRDTRRYMKRQLTWFRRNKRIEWFAGDDINVVIERISQQMHL